VGGRSDLECPSRFAWRATRCLVYCRIPEDMGAENRLLERVRSKEATIGVIGLGYVGLPFAVEKAKVGYRVLGIEQNLDRAGRVNRG